ncbi:MAG: L-fucose/L-arabinose isomerase family protein [Thermomicrobiales bacterium]
MESTGTTGRNRVRIGIFGIGLAAYWPQFLGLREGIELETARIRDRIAAWGDIVDGGIVDSASSGVDLGERFASERVDLVMCFVGTYSTSTQVLPVAQRSGVPIVLLNLQPIPAMDYATADTTMALQNAGVCAVPELAGVFARAGISYGIVTGHLRDESIWENVRGWCLAARAAKLVRQGRFGMLGHTYPGMLDMSTDVEQVAGAFGAHVEILEIDDLKDRVDAATDPEISAMDEVFGERFAIASDISPEVRKWGVQVAVALDRLAKDFALDGLAYYYRGTAGDLIEQIASSMIVGNTLLTERGVPAAGEGDLKTAIAMKIVHELEAGGSFCEFCAMDFNEKFFVMGHDGPCHPFVAEGKVTLKELSIFHGKKGGGLSVEMRAKSGPITIMGLTQTRDGRFRMLIAEGESLPGPILNIGNSNHRLRFCDDLAGFLETWCAQGPTHHVALGLGHIARDLKRVAMLLGIEAVQV